jgi:hypothetical protein
VRIITDPFSSRSGYDAINGTAGNVTLWYQNPKYHSCLDEIPGQAQPVYGRPAASGLFDYQTEVRSWHSLTHIAFTRRRRTQWLWKNIA